MGSDAGTVWHHDHSCYDHGDVMALTHCADNTVATYACDVYSAPTSLWESLTNGWHNRYLYDGSDQARYDGETSLYWMSMRAYDPTLGRFISHDPLGRAPLFFGASQPYAYGANNPLRNTDPSGQYSSGGMLSDGVFYRYGSGTRIEPTAPLTPHGSCRDNRDDPNPVCVNWRGAWRDIMVDNRNDKFGWMRVLAAVLWIGGLVAVTVTDWMLMNSTLKFTEFITGGRDLLLTAVSEGATLGDLLLPAGSPAHGILEALIAVAEAGLSLLHQLSALVAGAGWFVTLL